MDNVSQFAKGYEDYLQCPLQVRNVLHLALNFRAKSSTIHHHLPCYMYNSSEYWGYWIHGSKRVHFVPLLKDRGYFFNWPTSSPGARAFPVENERGPSHFPKEKTWEQGVPISARKQYCSPVGIQLFRERCVGNNCTRLTPKGTVSGFDFTVVKEI